MFGNRAKISAEELAYMKEQLDNDRGFFGIHTIKHSIATLAKDSINLTVNNIDNDILAKIIIMLDQTKVIDIYGVSGPLRIASDFQYKMFRIGKNVQIAPMVNEQLFQAAQSNKDHCAILISYSGETNEVIAAAELLKRRKVPMIAITSFGERDRKSVV